MEELSENMVRQLIALNLLRLNGFLRVKSSLKGRTGEGLLEDLISQSQANVKELEDVLKLYLGSDRYLFTGSTMKSVINDRDCKAGRQAVIIELLTKEQDVLITYDSLLKEGDCLDNDLYLKIRTQKRGIQESRQLLEKCLLH